VIISRKVVFSAAAAEQLRDAQLTMLDERIASAIWYLKRDTRHSRLKKVGVTSAGNELFAYSTVPTRRHPRLVLYVTVEGSMQDVTICGLMLPTRSSDGAMNE
jgi:hypothetical protein